MPLYFFHVKGGSFDVEDLEGRYLADLDAAHAVALAGARSLIAADVLEGRLSLSDRIEVLDEAGRTVLALSFADAVSEPVDLAPRPVPPL